MLLRQKPPENYVKITDKFVNRKLQENGFVPEYLYEKELYYDDTNKLIEFLQMLAFRLRYQGGEENCKKN